MTVKTTKPKCVLLDANIVIKAYELGIWQMLVQRCELILPSIVVHDEALFFRREIHGVPEEIDLRVLIEDGKITELSATVEELASLRTVFDRVFIEMLDPGEVEALALLKAGKALGASFCTGDAPAIQALAMIGMSARGISMGRLLESIGLTKRLKKQFTKRFFKENLRLGQQNRITDQGLAKGGLLEQL